MTRQLKYIRTKSGFIVFSEPIMHSEIRVSEEIISAGFCTVFDSVKCFGESISLGVSAKQDDSELLELQLRKMWA